MGLRPPVDPVRKPQATRPRAMSNPSPLENLSMLLGISADSTGILAAALHGKEELPDDLQQALVEFYQEWCSNRELPDIEQYVDKYGAGHTPQERQLLRMMLETEAEFCRISADGAYDGSAPKALVDRKRAFVARYGT